MKDINAGKLPKTIDCEIKDDLIDACISGDIVTICGIMKTELQNDMKGFGGMKCQRNKALHASYIDVNSIRNSNTEYFLTTAINAADNKMSLAELSLIHKHAERRDIFPLLIKSLCPSIYGHELVKAGLLLVMFGGSDYRLRNKGDFSEFMMCAGDKNHPVADEEMDDESRGSTPTIRPDIHLLMVGDPGLGKSQMLKHIINVAPRGVYVCGNSTTNAGLTATLVRDQLTNEQNLEAGALVLSNSLEITWYRRLGCVLHRRVRQDVQRLEHVAGGHGATDDLHSERRHPRLAVRPLFDHRVRQPCDWTLQPGKVDPG